MHKTIGSYDIIPEAMEAYINNYGCHFNKKLCEFAVSKMYAKNSLGKKERIKAYTKEQVDQILANNSITLEKGAMYDKVYVANMCKADFLGKSVPNETHLAKYVKDVIDDIDAEDGYVFNRWYADTVYMNIPIEWEDMI